MSRLWVSWEGPVSRWGHLGAKAEGWGRTLAAAHLVIRGPRSGGFSCRGEGVRACLGPGSPGSRAEAGGPIPTQIRGPGQEVRHSRERSAGAQESCQGLGTGWVPIPKNGVIGGMRAARGHRAKAAVTTRAAGPDEGRTGTRPARPLLAPTLRRCPRGGQASTMNRAAAALPAHVQSPFPWGGRQQ